MGLLELFTSSFEEPLTLNERNLTDKSGMRGSARADRRCYFGIPDDV
jgi:hypothetical protein